MSAIATLVPVTELPAMQAMGYAKFNKNPHLCVVVPDGGLTISCKTSEGELVTFAFQPYKTGGPAQCVDILHHTAKGKTLNGSTEQPVQEINVFSKGTDVLRTYAGDEKPATLVSLLFGRHKA